MHLFRRKFSAMIPTPSIAAPPPETSRGAIFMPVPAISRAPGAPAVGSLRPGTAVLPSELLKLYDIIPRGAQ